MQTPAILIIRIAKINAQYQVQLGAIDNVGNKTIPNHLAPLINLNHPHHKPVLVHTLGLRLVIGSDDVDDGELIGRAELLGVAGFGFGDLVDFDLDSAVVFGGELAVTDLGLLEFWVFLDLDGLGL